MNTTYLLCLQVLNDVLSSMITNTNKKVLDANKMAAELAANELAKPVFATLLDTAQKLESSIKFTRNIMLYRKWELKDPNTYIHACEVMLKS